MMIAVKTDFTHTSKALSQLENHLKCSVCHKFTRSPVTLGGCEHLFCSVCCEALLGSSCAVCHIPTHVKDAEVDKQLHNLANLCYRLRRVLSGGSQEPRGASADTTNDAERTSGTTPAPDSAQSKHVAKINSMENTTPQKQSDCSVMTSKETKKRRSSRGSAVKNQSEEAKADNNQSEKANVVKNQTKVAKAVKNQSKAAKADKNQSGVAMDTNISEHGNDDRSEDNTGIRKRRNDPVIPRQASRKTKGKLLDQTTMTQFYDHDESDDAETSYENTSLSIPNSSRNGSASKTLIQTTMTQFAEGEEENAVSESTVSRDKLKVTKRSQKRKSQDDGSSRKRTRLRHSVGGHEAETALLDMSGVESAGAGAKLTTPRASRRKSMPGQSEDLAGTKSLAKNSGKKSSRRKSLLDSPRVSNVAEKRGLQKEKVTPFASSKLAQTKVASPAIDKRNAKGETPLQVAAIKNDVDKVRELLSAGANPNVRDNAGWTPLHEACNHGYLEVATLLLDAGAMINVPGLENDTALHDAISNNRLDCVKLLVSRGASLTVRNMHGKTAWDLAMTGVMKKALETQVSTPSVSLDTQPLDVLEYQPPCLLGTGLSREGKVSLQKAASLLNVKLADEVTPEVTHIVTKCNAEGMCPRTVKLLHGILMGKWIVNTEWLSTCTEVSSLVCEEAFEVQGTSLSPNSGAPYKGRMNRKHQLPGLFNGCQFYFHGSFEYAIPSKEEVVSLVKAGDGQILSREPKSGHLDDLTLTVPYHSDPGSEIAHCSVFVVHENNVKFQTIRTKQMCSVPVSWIMDCASNFKLLPLPEK